MNRTITNATYFDHGWKHGELYVNDGLFQSEGNATEWDAQDYLILPGLINAHLHLGETIFCGKAPLDSLESYLDYTEEQSRHLPSNSHDIITRFTILESLRAGTTTFTAARGWGPSEKMGVRAMIGFPFMKSDKLKQYYDVDSCIQQLGVNARFPTGNLQMRTDLWIHSLPKIDELTLEKVAALYNETDICVAIHIAETETQVRETKNLYGCREMELLSCYDLLGERTNLIHALHLTDEELDLVAATQTNVTFCLSSNLSLYGTTPSLKPLYERGINVSLGTDGLATGQSASLLNEARIAQQVYDLSLEDTLPLITSNPAKTLRIPAGKLRTGYYADVTILSKETGQLVHVMIDGNFIVNNGKVMCADRIEKEFKELRGTVYG